MFQVGVSVCLPVTTASSTITAEPTEAPFGVWTRVGTKNHVSGRGPDPQGGQFLFLGGILCPIVKYREYPTQSQYSQPYLGGGSSNAACCCQYCSNLFLHFNHWRQRWLCAALWYQRDASASVIDCWVAEFTSATAVWMIHGLVGDSRHEIIVMRRTTRQAGHLISRLSIKPTMLRRTDWPSCGFTSHSMDAKWVILEKFPEASFLAWHGKNQSKHPKSTHSPIKRNVLKHKINTKNWNQV